MFFWRYVRFEVPCSHDDENDILSVWVLFFSMVAQLCFFHLCSKFHALILFIPCDFGLENAVSFNFALDARHVKRRVKSCRPACQAPTSGSVKLMQGMMCWIALSYLSYTSVYEAKSRVSKLELCPSFILIHLHPVNWREVGTKCGSTNPLFDTVIFAIRLIREWHAIRF